MGDLRFQPILRGAIGGVLAGLAPASGGPLLMLSALALLWSVADQRRAAGLWGFLAVLVSHRWLLGLHPLTWMGVPALLSLPVAISLLVLCATAAALLLLLWSVLARRLKTGDGSSWPPASVLLLALVWAGVELALEGSPLFWIGVGGSVLPFDRPLAGLARWVGSGGLALVQLVWGWALWQIWCQRGRRLRLWLSTFVLAHAVGALLLIPPASVGELQIGVWQTAIPTREKFNAERQKRLNPSLLQALDEAKTLGAELLVAPEGTLPSQWRPPASGLSLPLISGGFRWVRGEQRSSLLLGVPDRQSLQPLVDKHRLVPIGEWLPPLPAGARVGLSAVGGVQPGTASRLIDGLSPPAAAVICYEVSDGRAQAAATVHGAEWLLAVANLDPYPLLLQRQFLALAQLRAIETGRDLLSAANTGPTALITANGSVQSLLQPGVEGVALATVQRRRGLSPYARALGWLSSR
ncbi:MAG: apolipoprotein N-acyltransferase [Cyanobacteriota bacterium]|nr:apolipoprotein N-acyltransferase [Cyanobacteriota bacterium]